jgi:hypothetical protein
MNSQHRKILAAIRSESTERRGPCPFGLVAVALNVASNPGRDQIDRRIAELLRTGHLETVEDRVRGNGLIVTATGLRELHDTPLTSAGSVSSGGNESEPSPPPLVESETTPTGTTGDADLAAEGWSIMTGLAEIAIGKLQSLAVDDVAERAQLYALLRRYQRHTDALLERYGDEA